MANDPAPCTRTEWRAWIRTVKPGDVRRRAGVPQDELAARIGVGPSTLAGWERGYGLPSDGRGVTWYEAITGMAKPAGKRPARKAPVSPVLAAHFAGDLVLGGGHG